MKLLASAMAALCCVGCQKRDVAKAEDTKPTLAAQMVRVQNVEESQNDLRQVALFFKTYEGDMGHPPANMEEFIHYIQKDAPNLVGPLKDGKFVLVFEKHPGEQGNRIVAYEAKADLNDRHLVARADASVTLEKTAELNAALGKK